METDRQETTTYTQEDLYYAAKSGLDVGKVLFSEVIQPALESLDDDSSLDIIEDTLRRRLRSSDEIYSDLDIDAIKICLTYTLQNWKFPELIDILVILNQKYGQRTDDSWLINTLQGRRANKF